MHKADCVGKTFGEVDPLIERAACLIDKDGTPNDTVAIEVLGNVSA